MGQDAAAVNPGADVEHGRWGRPSGVTPGTSVDVAMPVGAPGGRRP